MNINFNNIPPIAVSFIRDSLQSSLNATQRKIVAIASIAFGLSLALLFICSICCKKKIKFLEKKADETKSDFKLDKLNELEGKLSNIIIGQPYAIKVTVDALMRHAAGLRNAKSPIGTFLYVGPTGVGKTQLAKELAIELMGSESRLIRMNMAEFREEHSLTRLIGSLPGYKEHEKGGQLTEQLKGCSHAVVLLDEIDKAHPAVLKVFLQAFDEGSISDAKGTVIDCRNIIFILTTNLASQKILDMHEDGNTEEEILVGIRDEIIKRISPELFNRLEVAPFMGLGEDQLDQLVKKLLQEMNNDLVEKKAITADFDQTVIDFIKANGFDYELGARPLQRLLEKTVRTSIAQEIIAGTIHSGDAIKVSYQNDKVLVEKIIAEQNKEEVIPENAKDVLKQSG